MPSPDALLRSTRIGLFCVALTAIGWGLNWPIIKLLLREWPPLFSRGSAGIAAALGLAGLAALRGERLRIPFGALRRLAFAAATNVFAWMGFSTLAMVWLSVAEGALLVYTMPIWATLLAFQAPVGVMTRNLLFESLHRSGRCPTRRSCLRRSVGGHVALDPLNLRPKPAQHIAGLLGCTLELRVGELPDLRHLTFDDEFRQSVLLDDPH
jgi:hypothetical protein